MPFLHQACHDLEWVFFVDLEFLPFWNCVFHCYGAAPDVYWPDIDVSPMIEVVHDIVDLVDQVGR